MLPRLSSARATSFYRLFSASPLTNTLPIIEDKSLSTHQWYKVLLDNQPNYAALDIEKAIDQQPTAAQFVESVDLVGQHSLDHLSPDMKLIGFHGASINSLPMLFPAISQLLRNQRSHHSASNPDNQCLHIADNLAAACHYSRINSVSLSGYTNPTHYDLGLIFVVFTTLVTQKELAPLTRRALMGHDYKRNISRRRGNEMLIPHEMFNAFSMLPLYKTPAVKRITPLKEGAVVHIDGTPHLWKDGKVMTTEGQLDLRPGA
ncbi:MAG: hypothetical protein P1U63_06180 [Coxiellaceae bacterium]|nr:hypothetical protein [Coxiellaceae bacterium]